MRRELRYVSNAPVRVIDEFQNETEAYLQDLSLHGLSIKSEGFIDIEPNSPYVVAIIPEKETNIKKFQLEIKSRWIKLNKSQIQSGFSVIVPFDEKGFKDYLEYLSKKNQEEPGQKE